MLTKYCSSSIQNSYSDLKNRNFFRNIRNICQSSSWVSVASKTWSTLLLRKTPSCSLTLAEKVQLSVEHMSLPSKLSIKIEDEASRCRVEVKWRIEVADLIGKTFQNKYRWGFILWLNKRKKQSKKYLKFVIGIVLKSWVIFWRFS